MLFSRLLRMKELSEEMAGIVPRSEKVHPVAVELGLQKDKGNLYIDCRRKWNFDKRSIPRATQIDWFLHHKRNGAL